MSRSSSVNLPKEGSIERGQVVRIEPYGAFVQFLRDEYSHVRGLVHISQISAVRLDRVEDALSLNDTVWVKVMEIIAPPPPPQDGSDRYKIRLSMKNVAQDGSALETAAEMEAQQQVSQAIEQNLSSSIGMGFARDPMAALVGSTSGNRLVLKKDQQSSTLINGYALVDDTEGELPVEEQHVTEEEPVKPMGRGRGTTLPAWMTKQQQEENGPTRAAEEEESRSRKKSSKRKRSRKKHKSSKGSKRERKHSDDDESEDDKRRRHRRHLKKKRRRRSRSESDDDDDSSRRQRLRHRHSSRERRFSDSENDVQFESVEDAKKLIREIEERRKRSRKQG